MPDNTLRLLLRHPGRVRAQIGITTLDENVAKVFEPNAATPSTRLRQMATLIAGGVATQARLDPVLPGVTDKPEALRGLFSALTKAGVNSVAVGLLFLRSRILHSLEQNVRDRRMLEETLNFYGDAGRLAIRAGSSTITALPTATREEVFTRIRRIAENSAIHVSVCACKNPDLARGTCGIGGAFSRRSDGRPQQRLFV